MLLHPLCTVGLLLLVAAGAAIGTFIEGAHGPITAREAVYESWWFLTLLGAVALQLLCVMWPNRARRNLFLLHGSLLLMLLAGLITLLFGQQGLVELRNGESSRTFWTQERYLELGAESRAFDPHPWARPVRIEHEGTSVELRRDPDAGPHAVILSVAGREQRLVVPPGPPRTITSDDGIVLRYGSRSAPCPSASRSSALSSRPIPAHRRPRAMRAECSSMAKLTSST
jgi:hypothetical protein